MSDYDCFQAISDDLDLAEPLMKVNAIADSVLEHTSSHGQSAIRHDLNNASVEVDRAKMETKQKLEMLDDVINKIKVLPSAAALPCAAELPSAAVSG